MSFGGSPPCSQPQTHDAAGAAGSAVSEAELQQRQKEKIAKASCCCLPQPPPPPLPLILTANQLDSLKSEMRALEKAMQVSHDGAPLPLVLLSPPPPLPASPCHSRLAFELVHPILPSLSI